MTTPQLPDEPIAEDVAQDVLGPKPGPGKERKSRTYRQITSVPHAVVNSLRHRAARLNNAQDPTQFREFSRLSLLTIALILDWKARNSEEVDEVKSAADGLVRIFGELNKAPKKAPK